MTPIQHAIISAHKFGGNEDDYLNIHEFLDQTKFHNAHFLHRMILHNTFGMQLCEQFFGTYIVNSDGAKVATRSIAGQHIRDDLGIIPTMKDWLQHVDAQPWMNSINKQSLKLLRRLEGKNTSEEKDE